MVPKFSIAGFVHFRGLPFRGLLGFFLELGMNYLLFTPSDAAGL